MSKYRQAILERLADVSSFTPMFDSRILLRSLDFVALDHHRADDKFYVYALLDPTKPGSFDYVINDLVVSLKYEPFYIGKGTGNRVRSHVAKLGRPNGGNLHKERRIHKILRSGAEPIEWILFENDLEGIALAREEALIRAIGRRSTKEGPLTNLSAGGIGSSGLKQDPEVVQKRAASLRGRKRSPEFREAVRQGKLGHSVSTETRDKIRKALTGRSMSMEQRLKISATLKGRPKDPFTDQHRENLSKAHLGTKQTPETLARMREAQRRRRQRESAEDREAFRKRCAESRALTPKVKCPHCDKEGHPSNMSRYHFDNCKHANLAVKIAAGRA